MSPANKIKTMSLIDSGKRHLIPGLISQLLITALATAASTLNDITIALTGFLARQPPAVKYGPPINPSDFPVPKYGAPVSPTPFPGLFDTGTQLTGDHVITWLLTAASLAIYAWVLLGWAFWGGIWYLNTRMKR